jgi:hypothetical protein
MSAPLPPTPKWGKAHDSISMRSAATAGTADCSIRNQMTFTENQLEPGADSVWKNLPNPFNWMREIPASLSPAGVRMEMCHTHGDNLPATGAKGR